MEERVIYQDADTVVRIEGGDLTVLEYYDGGTVVMNREEAIAAAKAILAYYGDETK